MVNSMFVETVRDLVKKDIDGKLPTSGKKLLQLYLKEFTTEPTPIMEYRLRYG